MHLDVFLDYRAVSERAAAIVAHQIQRKPASVIGFATGGTPIGMYKNLVSLHKDEGLDFSHITSFNLDEYVGLGADHAQSYHAFMWEHLFEHVNVNRTQIHIPDGLATNPDHFCAEYERAISQSGGIDLQILGIGSNGHIAFNEPNSSFTSRTRVVALAENTIVDNARFFNRKEEVPRQAITMGIETILEARTILLISTGTHKASILVTALEGRISPSIPASALQHHGDVHILADEAAASLLTPKP